MRARNRKTEFTHQSLGLTNVDMRLVSFSSGGIWALTAKVVLPALLVSLLFGVFVFSDQLMMQKLIPVDGHAYYASVREQMGQQSWDRALQLIYGSSNVPQERINADWILATVSAAGTIDLMIVSLGLFVSTGSAVLYSRALAAKNQLRQSQIVRTGFYGSLLTSFALTIVILGVQHLIVPTVLPNPVDSANSGATTGADISVLTSFYLLRNEVLANLSNNYLYFLSASVPIISLVNFYTFMLRGENRNLMITVFSIGCNVLNILMDYALIGGAKIGTLGGGASTLIGYIVNLAALLIYVSILEKRGQTGLGFTQLRKIFLSAESMFVSFALGAGTFLRDLSLAIANIVYLPVWYSTMTATGGANIVYAAQSVAPAPIYNLFFFAVFGIIDGMRPLLTHCLALKNYNRTKKIFWYGVCITMIYALIVNLIILPCTYVRVTGNGFLQFFGAVNPDGTLNPLRAQILDILVPSLMLQFFFLAVAVPGLGLFQAAGKTLMSGFLSILQGVITFFPILYAMSAISIAADSWQTMTFTGFTNIVVSSLIIFGSTLGYMYSYMGKKEKFSDPQEAVDAAIKRISNAFGLKDKNN